MRNKCIILYCIVSSAVLKSQPSLSNYSSHLADNQIPTHWQLRSAKGVLDLTGSLTNFLNSSTQVLSNLQDITNVINMTSSVVFNKQLIGNDIQGLIESSKEASAGLSEKMNAINDLSNQIKNNINDAKKIQELTTQLNQTISLLTGDKISSISGLVDESAGDLSSDIGAPLTDISAVPAHTTIQAEYATIYFQTKEQAHIMEKVAKYAKHEIEQYAGVPVLLLVKKLLDKEISQMSKDLKTLDDFCKKIDKGNNFLFRMLQRYFRDLNVELSNWAIYQKNIEKKASFLSKDPKELTNIVLKKDDALMYATQLTHAVLELNNRLFLIKKKHRKLEQLLKFYALFRNNKNNNNT